VGPRHRRRPPPREGARRRRDARHSNDPIPLLSRSGEKTFALHQRVLRPTRVAAGGVASRRPRSRPIRTRRSRSPIPRRRRRSPSRNRSRLNRQSHRSPSPNRQNRRSHRSPSPNRQNPRSRPILSRSRRSPSRQSPTRNRSHRIHPSQSPIRSNPTRSSPSRNLSRRNPNRSTRSRNRSSPSHSGSSRWSRNCRSRSQSCWSRSHSNRSHSNRSRSNRSRSNRSRSNPNRSTDSNRSRSNRSSPKRQSPSRSTPIRTRALPAPRRQATRRHVPIAGQPPTWRPRRIGSPSPPGPAGRVSSRRPLDAIPAARPRPSLQRPHPAAEPAEQCDPVPQPAPPRAADPRPGHDLRAASLARAERRPPTRPPRQRPWLPAASTPGWPALPRRPRRMQLPQPRRLHRTPGSNATDPPAATPERRGHLAVPSGSPRPARTGAAVLARAASRPRARTGSSPQRPARTRARRTHAGQWPRAAARGGGRSPRRPWRGLLARPRCPPGRGVYKSSPRRAVRAARCAGRDDTRCGRWSPARRPDHAAACPSGGCDARSGRSPEQHPRLPAGRAGRSDRWRGPSARARRTALRRGRLQDRRRLVRARCEAERSTV
jgi:hypothetical protein